MIRLVTWVTPNQSLFDTLAPAGIFSALDKGIYTILLLHPDIVLPKAIASASLVEVRQTTMENYGTTNMHVPRYYELPDLVKKHKEVFICDLDLLILHTPKPPTQLMFWANGLMPYWEDSTPWNTEGRKIMGGFNVFCGDVGYRFAVAMKQELKSLPDQELNTHFADQVCLWRTWSLRGPWPTIRSMNHLQFGIPSSGKPEPLQPFIHPYGEDATYSGWAKFTKSYIDRWNALQ